MLVEICEATGGPCTYQGRSMQAAHNNMKVTEGEFNVPQAEQDQLLGMLAPMKRDIVEGRGQATGTALPEKYVPAPPLTGKP